MKQLHGPGLAGDLEKPGASLRQTAAFRSGSLVASFKDSVNPLSAFAKRAVLSF